MRDSAAEQAHDKPIVANEENANLCVEMAVGDGVLSPPDWM